jgi:hypothetical protein
VANDSQVVQYVCRKLIAHFWWCICYYEGNKNK